MLGIVMGLLLGVGWNGVGWAAEPSGQGASDASQEPQVTKGGPGDINQDKAEVREDRMELDKDAKAALTDRETTQKDWARYQQDKQRFDKRLAELDAQRATALKTGNAKEAARLEEEIRADRRRLRAEYDATAKAAKGYLVEKEKARRDWVDYNRDRSDLFKDEGRTRTAGEQGLKQAGAVPEELDRDRDIRQDRRDLHEDRKDIRQDTQDIRHDRQDLKGDIKDLERDRRSGDTQDISQDLSDVKKDEGDLSKDVKDLHQDQRDLGRDRRDLSGDVRDLRSDRGNAQAGSLVTPRAAAAQEHRGWGRRGGFGEGPHGMRIPGGRHR